jgi:hypothetical protein
VRRERRCRSAGLAHRPNGGHSRGIGPLRWLPATPQPLRDDPHWGPYLTRRGALVSELADQVRHTARSWTHGNAPAWARPLLGTNAALAAEIAVFRAAVGVAEEDTRLLGAEQYPARTRAIQLLLQTHAAQANGRPGADTSRWHNLIDSINPRIRTDNYWPQLATHLAQAAHSCPNLRDLLTEAAAHGPLPDELPAAALWWRLAGSLAPATLDTPTHDYGRRG